MEEKKITTPTREMIIEEATKLYMQDNWKNFDTTPEPEELKEEGYTQRARNELMRNEGKGVFEDFKDSIAENEYKIVKIKEGEQQKTIELKETFTIDTEEALRSGVFISGGKGTTKSNLAFLIADKLMRKGVTVKVFDISQAWQKRSSVPNLVKVDSNSQLKINLYQSVIFDLSRLTPQAAKEFISKVLEVEWRLQIDTPEQERKSIVYVLEECQMLVPQGQLRSKEAQVILRLLSVGRNFRLGFIAITQRPALTDTSVFELTFQKYFARMTGENDLQKVSSYIGTENAKQLQNLRLGEFCYDMGSSTKWIKTAKFETEVKPSRVRLTQPVKEAKPEKETQSTETDMLRIASIVLQLGSLFLFLVCLAIALTSW